jgi:dTDP-4-amino-4,6-dideoxygalactose transaminase
MEKSARGMKRHRIPLARPSVGKEELAAIQRVFESGMLTEWDVTARFEKEFAKYLGAKSAVATTSCTTAMDLALLALEVKQGDEVIVPDFTYPATGNVVFHVGAKPVLVDIDVKTYNVNPERIEEAITRKTKAIMPVHLFGQCAEMEKILEIAEEHDLYVIEDAACGIGSTRHGKKAGTFGNASCFSLHPRKILATGEGGMLVTDDNDLAEKARIWKNHGIKKTSNSRPSFVKAGYNFRLNDIASAIGLVQLKKVPVFIRERVGLARRYTSLLADEKHVETPYVAPSNNHTYQTYCVKIKKERVRDRLITELAARGIETQIGTYALHLQPIYEMSRRTGRASLSASEAAFRNTLSLPMYNGLTEREQERVCENLADLLRHSAL